MLVSFDVLVQRFADYTDVKGKIRREVQVGRLVQVARGLYETDARTDGKYLAEPSTGRPTSRSTMPCPSRAHSRGGLRHLYFGDVPQGQDQALRKRLRHFFVPRRSRCRVPARRGDQSGGGIFLSDRLTRKSAVRQVVFAFARVLGEGAQRTAVRRFAHRRGRLLCFAKGRHLAARAALPRHRSEIARKVHGGKVS